MEQVIKVARLNENPIGNEEEVIVDDGGDETDDTEISHMNKLPPEMLIEILEYLDNQELATCRLLSSQFNEISCSLLQCRTKNNTQSRLVVRFDSLQCITYISKPMTDFLDCFGPSQDGESSGSVRHFPFSTFHFRNISSINIDLICEIVSTFGPQMKIVFVNIDEKENTSFETLWKLLLQFAPNIQHFCVIDDHSSPSLNLLHPVDNAEHLTDNVKVLDINNSFLKNLRVLEILSLKLGPYDFVKVLLENTPNLEEVSIVRSVGFYDLINLEICQQVQRGHLLRKLEISSISISSDLAPVELMKNLRLKELIADFNIPLNYVETEVSTINYIYHALKSNKETLSRLKLNNVTVESMNSCFRDIKSLPNVFQLEIQIRNAIETREILKTLGKLCSNITILNLCRLHGDFVQVPPVIWTGFKELKSLKFSVDTNAGQNNPLALDSAFSGYSTDSIQIIQSRFELDEGISLEEALGEEAQSPSILDLNGLSRLELSFCLGNRNDATEEVENQIRNSVFVKILPQHIRENPRSILYTYTTN